MRAAMYWLLAIGLIVLSCLWFFTPVLDKTYHSTLRNVVTDMVDRMEEAPSRPASPDRDRSSESPTRGPVLPPIDEPRQVASEFDWQRIVDILNVAFGAIGAVFGYLGYARSRRQDQSQNA